MPGLGRLAGMCDCSCARGTGIAMRISIIFFAIVGVVLIVFGCILENPPHSYGPAMFVAVGSLNIFAAMAGFWGSYHKKAVLMVFIIFGGISLLLQIIFEITLMVNFEKTVNAVAPPSRTDPIDQDVQDEHDEAARDLNVMRWFALGFLFMELATLILAILLKWVIKEEDNRYTGFDEDSQERRMLQMNDLRSDIETAGKKQKDSAYDKIRQKMSAKYGAAAPGEGWKSKTKMSWQTG